ncbi:hypothetical protein [Halorussus ruber]|uniref:hypothetical protein n=1 Tax=Halorussus ruber TaxID=1126238 RepID=UPI00109272FE|nr:hypothetical protein [Halorussus ruber]
MLGRNLLPSGNAGVPSLSYYDLVLALLPVPLLVGLLVGKFVGIPVSTGVSVGAVLSAMGVGHVLFRKPPTRRGPRGGDGGPRGRIGGPSA